MRCAFIELPLLVTMAGVFVGTVAVLMPKIGWLAIPCGLIGPVAIFGAVWFFVFRKP